MNISRVEIRVEDPRRCRATQALRGTMMTDDNTIDINDRLPSIEVRKPWRQKLPDRYAKRIDDLKALREKIQVSRSLLRTMHREFGEFSACMNRRHEVELERIRDEISAALVLLECAEDKLVYTIPTEEFMDRESLEKFWDHR